MDIANRVAIITGAARGIGRATALCLARAGARAVVLADIDAEGLAGTGAELAGHGCEALPVVTDVTVDADVENLFAQAQQRFGQIDIVFNNAGTISGQPGFPDIAAARIKRVIDLNLTAVVMCTQVALRYMRRQGHGIIINNASIFGLEPYFDDIPYAASKAGVVMIGRSCAALRKTENIRVHTVCPGVTNTPLLASSDNGEAPAWLIELFRSIKVLEPEDIAAAVRRIIEDDDFPATELVLANVPRPEPAVEGDGGHYLLELGALADGGPVTISPSLSGLAITGDFAPLVTGEAQARIRLAPGNFRHYFHCAAAAGATTVLAKRGLDLEGITNLRDMGGYPAGDGRAVKWGCLYRSGRLSDLNLDDDRHFDSLDIRLVCDFRHGRERAVEHTWPASAQTKVMWLGIDPGSVIDFFGKYKAGTLAPEQMTDMMSDVYVELVLEHAHRYRDMFDLILSQPDGAVLIHCSAGKDRTGVGAALILAALGVPRASIIADYLLSNRYYAVAEETRLFCEKHDIDGAGADELFRPIMEVREAYLQSAFAAIDRQFGGLDQYLSEALGMNEARRDALRHRYLL